MIINREILNGQGSLDLATAEPYGSHLSVCVEANWANAFTDPAPTPGDHQVDFTLDWSDIDGVYNGNLTFFLPSTTVAPTEPWILRSSNFGYGFMTRIVFQTPVHIVRGGLMSLGYKFVGPNTFGSLAMLLRVSVTPLPM